MERAIVLDVPDKDRRGVTGGARKKHSRARNTCDPFYLDEKLFDGNQVFKQSRRDRHRSAMPDVHHPIDSNRQDQWYVATVKEFAAKNATSTTIKAPATPMLVGMLHPQISRRAMSNKTDVISIVAETAMP